MMRRRPGTVRGGSRICGAPLTRAGRKEGHNDPDRTDQTADAARCSRPRHLRDHRPRAGRQTVQARGQPGRGGPERRKDRSLHGDLRRGRAGGDQRIPQEVSLHPRRDDPRAGRPADHLGEDRSRGRQAHGRPGAALRPRTDEGARQPVPGLCAAERRRLSPRGAGLAETVAEHHARLVDRLQQGAGEEFRRSPGWTSTSPNTATARSAR